MKARRLIRMASEDIGLSNPMAVTQAVSAYQATQLIGIYIVPIFLFENLN
jgi:putative ATPase